MRPGPVCSRFTRTKAGPIATAAEKHIKVYNDGYEELLDDPNVEAVIIALPLALAPPGGDRRDAQGQARAHRKADGARRRPSARRWPASPPSSDANGNPIILAVGHQRHYSILYDNAVEQIKQGLIGDIHHIRAQWHRGNLPGNDSWQPPLPGDKKLAERAEQLEIRARRHA